MLCMKVPEKDVEMQEERVIKLRWKYNEDGTNGTHALKWCFPNLQFQIKQNQWVPIFFLKLVPNSALVKPLK